jgi:hypothetical protein
MGLELQRNAAEVSSLIGYTINVSRLIAVASRNYEDRNTATLPDLLQGP